MSKHRAIEGKGRSLPEQGNTEFGVRVTKVKGGYDVAIWEHEPGKPHKGLDFANVSAQYLDVALKMAVPYMAAAAQPDPFAHLWRDTKPEAETTGSGRYGGPDE